ncbi:MAG: C40 family peptidase, partial [Gemmatimonadaceae bacterium]|nr:C40 family peptidase [Gemmatimonadaceae bacterium]
MLCEPDVKTTQASQLLHGHIAEIVERQGLWLKVQSADAYQGWLHQGYVVTVPDPVPAPADTGWDDPRPLSLGCTVRDARGATRKLPLGALITAGEERSSGLAMSLEERRHSFPRNADSITTSAMTYFEGTSYEWGGLTPWGCDCSGLVQSSFRLHGVGLPRDAWMQAGTGEPVEGMTDL